MTQCLDTSAVLECWSRYYPIDVFPRLWDRLAELIAAGEIIAPDEVHEEIKRKDDELAGWVKNHTRMFVPLDADVQRAAREVLSVFPELVKELGGRNQADPFVVALARVRGATVVTQEKGGSRARPRLPMVCEHFGVEHTDVIGFIRRRGWSF